MTTTTDKGHADPTRNAEDLRIEVRRFLEQLLAEGRFEPTVDSWMTGWDEDFSRLLGSRGYLGITLPVEYGGKGGSYLERFAVTEELLAAGAPIAAHWIADRQIAPALLKYGTEEQKERYLPRIAAGECYFAIGMSEPDAGSDLAAVRTKARKADGGWVLDGSKVWTSGAHRAEAFFVLARTESAETAGRHGGLSQFIVNLRDRGVEIRPIWSASGEHHFNEVFLTDVFVRDSDVLGEIGDGWAQVTRELSFERSGPERFLSTYPLFASTVAESLPELADHDAGRYIARYSALHRMSHRVSNLLQSGVPAGTAAAQVKVLGGKFEGDVVAWADEVVNRSPTKSLPPNLNDMLDRAFLQRPGFTLRGGSSEILRDVIAGGLMKSTAWVRIATTLDIEPALNEMIEEFMADTALHDGPTVRARAWDPKLWRRVEELGLARITGRPDRGGSGAGWAEATSLLEAAAAHDVELPFVEHDLLAGWLSDQLELPESDGVTGFALVRPDGCAANVAWAGACSQFLVVHGDRVAVASPDSVGISASRRHDHSGDIQVDMPAMDWRTVAPALIEELRYRGGLARAVQMVGAMGSVVESAVNHVRDRRQFGQSLAKFQAIRGLLSEMAAEGALAAASVSAAVEAAEGGDIGADSARRHAVAVAKSCAGHASEVVIRNGHQLHGAVGTTLEHNLHRYTGSLLRWRNDFGSAAFWDRCVVQNASSREFPSLWEQITAAS